MVTVGLANYWSPCQARATSLSSPALVRASARSCGQSVADPSTNQLKEVSDEDVQRVVDCNEPEEDLDRAGSTIQLMQHGMAPDGAERLASAPAYQADGWNRGSDSDADHNKPKPSPYTASSVTVPASGPAPERKPASLPMLARGQQQPQPQPQQAAFSEPAMPHGDGTPAWHFPPQPPLHQESVSRTYRHASLPPGAPVLSPVYIGGVLYCPHPPHFNHSALPYPHAPAFAQGSFTPGSLPHGPYTHGFLSRSAVVGDPLGPGQMYSSMASSTTQDLSYAAAAAAMPHLTSEFMPDTSPSLAAPPPPPQLPQQPPPPQSRLGLQQSPVSSQDPLSRASASSLQSTSATPELSRLWISRQLPSPFGPPVRGLAGSATANSSRSRLPAASDGAQPGLKRKAGGSPRSPKSPVPPLGSLSRSTARSHTLRRLKLNQAAGGQPPKKGRKQRPCMGDAERMERYNDRIRKQGLSVNQLCTNEANSTRNRRPEAKSKSRPDSSVRPPHQPLSSASLSSSSSAAAAAAMASASVSLSEAAALQTDTATATARARARSRAARMPVLPQLSADGEFVPSDGPPTYHPSPDILTDAAAQKACDELMTLLENGGWDVPPEPRD